MHGATRAEQHSAHRTLHFARRALCAALAFAAVVVFPRVSAQQAPVFRGGIDVVSLDVTVVDKNGAPVEGLKPGDFVVKIDGQPRVIRTLDYLRFGATSGSSVAAPADRAPVSNTRPADAAVASRGGRVILLLFDDLSAKPGDAKELIVSAERVLNTLGPDDLVGLATTSAMGPTISPTRDRTPILAALHSKTLIGRDDNVTLPYYITVKEAVDIVDGRQNDVLMGVADRECGGATLDLDGCARQIAMAADRLMTWTYHRAASQLTAYASAMHALEQAPKPRIIIALTQGLAFGAGRLPQEDFDPISHAAAQSDVQFYALADIADPKNIEFIGRPPLPPYDRVSAGRLENQYLTAGVQVAAAAAGGEAFQVVGQADRLFKRVFAETSGFYTLGVEIPPHPETEKFLDVKVSVNRPGTTVRAHRHALVPGAVAAATPASVDAALQLRLSQGGVAFGVPVTLATVLRRDAGGRLQLGVEAQVPGTIPAPLVAMFAVVDGTGKVVQSGRREIGPAAAGDDYRIAFGVPMADGDYRFRFAVADGSGNIGSVQRQVSGALARFGRLLASDLITTWTGADQTPRFLALDLLPPAARALNATVELYPDAGLDPATVSVRFTLVKAADSTLVSTEDVIPEPGGSGLLATSAIDVTSLAPGSYSIRAEILSSGITLGAVSTIFRKSGSGP